MLIGAGCGSMKSSGFDGGSSSGSSGGFGTRDAAKPTACVALECQQKRASAARDTTMTGTVFVPSGKLPLSNAILYVPNATPDPITRAAICDTCGAVTGSPWSPRSAIPTERSR